MEKKKLMTVQELRDGMFEKKHHLIIFIRVKTSSGHSMLFKTSIKEVFDEFNGMKNDNKIRAYFSNGGALFIG